MWLWFAFDRVQMLLWKCILLVLSKRESLPEGTFFSQAFTVGKTVAILHGFINFFCTLCIVTDFFFLIDACFPFFFKLGRETLYK